MIPRSHFIKVLPRKPRKSCWIFLSCLIYSSFLPLVVFTDIVSLLTSWPLSRTRLASLTVFMASAYSNFTGTVQLKVVSCKILRLKSNYIQTHSTISFSSLSLESQKSLRTKLGKLNGYGQHGFCSSSIILWRASNLAGDELHSYTNLSNQ